MLATWNPGKQAWMAEGLQESGLSVRALPQGIPEAEETGSSCEENALLKVEAIKSVVGEGFIAAEDSGLFIEALGGFPGVRTARFSEGSDDDRSLVLLDRMAGTPLPSRKAMFVSAVAVAFPDGTVRLFHGELHGEIAPSPSGELSGGYDRIFRLPSGKTLAMIPEELRLAGNHRSQALLAAARAIRDWHQSRQVPL